MACTATPLEDDDRQIVVSTSLPRALKTQAKIRACVEGRPLATLIADALRQYLTSSTR